MTVHALARGPIFVPLDGSELAERALPYATALATALERPIVLMTASRTPEIWNNVPAGGEYDGKARDHCQKYLESVRGRLEPPEVQIEVRDGFARDEILNAAHDCDASLIVVASHGRSGITRWMYGSIASHLAHEADLPLLVIGREPLARPSEVSIRKIMVPLDGSTLAEEAIVPAAQLASAFQASISLVRVSPWAIAAYPYFESTMYLPQLDTDLETGAESYLRTTCSKLEPGLHGDAVLLRGPAASSLLQFEEEHEIDLVVMTTHARAGFQRALLGSTADRLLQGKAPVLLVRPHQHEAGS